MDLEGYRKLFATSKSEMDLNDAAVYIHHLKETIYPMMTKNRLNAAGYSFRLSCRAVCEEAEQAIMNALPWDDWREIFAELEWKTMRRVVKHSMEDIYSYRDGRKWGEADVWFLDMWRAYHDVFCNMPGGPLPDIGPWRIYHCLMEDISRKLAKYRRN
mgnify:CR=1 FL=1